MIHALTGGDIVQLDDRIFTDFADGDIATLEFPNDIGAVKTGKNGNSIYAFNATGLNVRPTLRIIMGSSDDKWLQSRIAEWINNPSTFNLITGKFIKNTGDGSGNVTKNIYNLMGGIFLKIPEAKSNVEGDTDQSVVIWNLTFSNGVRQLT
ncbi:MAG: hypothetical protein KAV87_19775, partial [Desulfobacteraceae bacterium]|nr:hypothetical protein [Desulfobacteraceae bacterium]